MRLLSSKKGTSWPIAFLPIPTIYSLICTIPNIIMKHAFTILILILLAATAVAQTPDNDDSRATAWRHALHHRDQYQPAGKRPIPVATTTTEAKGTTALPTDRVWFPGEWEEVKAVVVTPDYLYRPANQPQNEYYSAEPIFRGLAEYYRYNNERRWVSTGEYGPYVSILDTTSRFGRVFFNLMDGIQQGHAEAWVRVERPADTASVLRTLSRMQLRHDSVRFIIAPGNSFWMRDCGPICFYHGDHDSLAMLDFTYYTHRNLDDSLPSFIYQQMGIPNYSTTIEYEGGNCLVDGAGALITSDRIYRANGDTVGPVTWDGHNPSSIHYQRKEPLSPQATRQAMASLIGQRVTYVMPAFQYDGGTGHVDLYVDMCEENGFVFSRMPERYSDWDDYATGQSNIDTLCAYPSLFNRPYYGSEIPFPSKENGRPFADQDEYNKSYTRSYSNHIIVNNLIIQPCFSNVVNGLPSERWDLENIKQLQEAYPGYTIYCIDVRTFNGMGGAIHCITKQIPADNPVRILHKSVVGNASDMHGNDIPVSAIVTNRDGIAHAECIYRIGGAEWDTLRLAANGNKFSSRIPTASIVDGFPDTSAAKLDTTVTVDYYLSVTTTTGKTVTKPMTARQGGYYTFYFDNTRPPIDSSRYDFDTTNRPMDDITFAFDSRHTSYDTSSAPHLQTIVHPMESGFGQFYPNPAEHQASIAIDLGEGSACSIVLYDNLGRTVHRSTLQGTDRFLFSISTDGLPSGIYTAVFQCRNRCVVRRLAVR